MENKLYIKNDKIIRLLPRYFKWIGLGIILLSGVFSFFSNEALHNPNETLKIIAPRLFLLGLLVIALAKDKLEDEMTLLIRLRVMASIFITTIMIVIIQPLVDFIVKDPIGDVTPIHLILRMLIAYHVLFFFVKKFR
jgi:hypothetical protein